MEPVPEKVVFLGKLEGAEPLKKITSPSPLKERGIEGVR